MLHHFTLRDGPFASVKSGRKTIELRLYDEKRRLIQVGDSIRFTRADSEESVTSRVIALHPYPDFDALYADLIPRKGAAALGYLSTDRPDPADMLDYYNAEAIARYGVLGIELAPVEENGLTSSGCPETPPTDGSGAVPAAGGYLPAEFLIRMERMLGNEYKAFCASYRKPVRTALRVNTLKCAADMFFADSPFPLSPIAWQEAGFYVDVPAASTKDSEGLRPGKHALHEAGVYYIQEASAQLPGALCPPRPGERVLDLCAAPGGKATQLAAALAGKGLLVANEIHPTRALVLSQNIERMGVRNALVTNATPDELADRFPSFFDKIVVDAPCSGEGMFRREPDAVSMWSPENVALCAERQASILDRAAAMLSPGGYLIYSTCTFAPEENEGTVLAFLARHPDFTVVPSASPAVAEARKNGLLDGGHPEWVTDVDLHPALRREALRHAYRVLPHHADGEGHFACLLRKEGGCEEDGIPARAAHASSRYSTGRSSAAGGRGRNQQRGKPQKGTVAVEMTVLSLLHDFCRAVFGGTPAWLEDTVPCLFGERLCLVPRALTDGLGIAGATGNDVQTALRGLRVLRAGVVAGTVMGMHTPRPRLEPDHAFALATVPDESTAVFPLEAADISTPAIRYLRGETLPAPASLRGWYVVTYDGYPLGWGKAGGELLKNHYPKGLRRN